MHKPTKVEIPGPTVTKKVEVTKTVRPPIPDSVSRSNERKTPKTSAVPRGSARTVAQSIFGSQFSCADSLIAKESGWNVSATNPSSGAYGLGQALPPSKMTPYGSDWRTSARTQLTWMKAYLDGRYGGACAGWEFWKSHHWY
ncbi:aggregation-promoting factor C-terminal-like domain-containing protein [Streptomyces ardesiacus]